MKKWFILFVVFCFTAVFSPIADINAQEPSETPLIHAVWERLGGPIGGIGYDIRMDPRNPDVMYVTDAMAGVHKSMDGGNTWFPTNTGIDKRQGPSSDEIPVFCLTIDPNHPDTVWVGLQDLGGVYRSDDGGQTWQLKNNGIPYTVGFTIRGVTIEPGNSDVVYVAGEIASWRWNSHVQLQGIEFDRVKGVVYRSVNGGNSWQQIWFGDSLARYVLIDPKNVNSIYVSTGIFDREAANSDPTAKTPGGVGVLHSTDGGATWIQVNNGLGNQYVGSLYMHPENPQVLLAATGNNSYRDGGGVYLTTNGGQSWEYKAGSHLTSVEISETNPNIMYAAGDFDFFRSDDAGKTWLKLSPENGWGVPGIRPGFPIDMQADPRNPYRVFVNNYGGGNFISEDGGETWRSTSDGYTGAEIHGIAIDPNNPAVVFVNGRSGPFRSFDGGHTWTGINQERIPEGVLVVLDPGDPGHSLISEGTGPLLLSGQDMGNQMDRVWDQYQEMRERMANGEAYSFQGFTALAFAPSNKQRVYGGCGNLWCYRDANVCKTSPMMCGFMVSDDSGNTWRNPPNPMIDGNSITTIAVHPWDENILWIGVPNSGVYRSVDGGETWEPLNNGLWNKLVMSLAVNPHNPDILFAGVNNGGMFKSVDGGNTWVHSSAGLDPNEDVMAVVVDPVRENVVFAGSISGGFFISQDGGATWEQHNEGLHTRAIRVLALSSDGETLYAGTKGGGVYRLSNLPQEVFDEIGPKIEFPAEEPYDSDMEKPGEEPRPEAPEKPSAAPPVAPPEPSAPQIDENPLRSVCPVSLLPVFVAMALVACQHKKNI